MERGRVFLKIEGSIRKRSITEGALRSGAERYREEHYGEMHYNTERCSYHKVDKTFE